jgi:hypothetical protein
MNAKRPTARNRLSSSGRRVLANLLTVDQKTSDRGKIRLIAQAIVYTDDVRNLQRSLVSACTRHAIASTSNVSWSLRDIWYASQALCPVPRCAQTFPMASDRAAAGLNYTCRAAQAHYCFMQASSATLRPRVSTSDRATLAESKVMNRFALG